MKPEPRPPIYTGFWTPPLTPDAAIKAAAKVFNERGVELIRSDLSVQEQDRLRAALDDSADAD